MAKHPVFPMWVTDYLADTSHLDATEHGVYHLLLYRYWLTDGRALSEDLTVLRRIAKCRSKAIVERILTEFWELYTGEGWHHKRAQHEFRVTRDRSYAARENAKKRWKIKGDTHANAHASAMLPSPSGEYIYINNKTESKRAKNVPKGSSCQNKSDWEKHQDWEADIQAQAAEKGLSARPGESWQAFAARVRTTRRASQ